MNWKWLIGGLGVAGVLAYFAKAQPSASAEPFEEPDTRPAVRRTPVWEESPAPVAVPFVAKVELLIRGMEWPFVSLAKLRRDAAGFAQRFVQSAHTQCVGFPTLTGTPTVLVVEGGEGIFVTMAWAPVVWTPSAEITACVRRVLAADDELGARLRRVSVHA